MSLIGLIRDPTGSQCYGAVQISHLLNVTGAVAQPATHLDIELPSDLVLDPAEIGVAANKGEVVAAHYELQLLSMVHEVARRRLALLEAEIEQAPRVGLLPPLRGVPGAIYASVKPAADPWLVAFCKELDICQLG
ncbi:unnamed protein product [Polarella glacialis]|uniref:Uncharacterized protein n=1 Tax=Polarella glacialis TaxID=89957 RepID=A0A813KP96_POLGL|nr:unnamed protein product [Polarella glacialis]